MAAALIDDPDTRPPISPGGAGRTGRSRCSPASTTMPGRRSATGDGRRLGTSLVLIPGAAHSPAVENPDRLGVRSDRLVRRWTRGHSLDRPPDRPTAPTVGQRHQVNQSRRQHPDDHRERGHQCARRPAAGDAPREGFADHGRRPGSRRPGPSPGRSGLQAGPPVGGDHLRTSSPTPATAIPAVSTPAGDSRSRIDRATADDRRHAGSLAVTAGPGARRDDRYPVRKRDRIPAADRWQRNRRHVATGPRGPRRNAAGRGSSRSNTSGLVVSCPRRSTLLVPW